MQGWTPDFIPKLTGDVVDSDVIDRILTIAGPDAIRCSQELAQQEGIFVGISSGATFAGALQICQQAEPGATVLCMLPDTGERYLSTPLFADIAIDMTDQEQEISHTTPNYHVAPPA
jgi:cysteine synthase A